MSTDTKNPIFKLVFVHTDGTPGITFSKGLGFKVNYTLRTHDNSQVVQRCGPDDTEIIISPTMLVYRFATGLCPWVFLVRDCTVGKLVWEIDYEHIDEQPHRTDFEAMEATSKKHNREKACTYGQFITCNPGYKARWPTITNYTCRR